MSYDEPNGTDRRTFLQAGALATAAAAGLANGTVAGAQEPAKPKVLPRRMLGKTGVEITMLEYGSGGKSDVLDRLLRVAYAGGVRTFDTAKVYGSEPAFKKWFEQSPEVRRNIFLVTKDGPRDPAQMMPMVDQRLAALGVDHLDAFYLHGLGDDDWGGPEESIKLITSKEFAAAADKVKKSGKAKFIGFSTHHKDRAAIIEAAAKTGVIDIIMLQYTPWLEKDEPLNKAIDAAHKAGIGLISMKQVAGQFPAKPKFDVLKEVVKRTPMLAEKKLSPYQGLLHAIWTDERISGSCVSMKNGDQLRENIDATLRFEPMKAAELKQLRDAVLAFTPTLCADCDGRCSLAAGTKAELGNLTRFLTYHEHHGERSKARREYAALAPEARDWSGADLAAATKACPNHVDFEALMPQVDKHLA